MAGSRWRTSVSADLGPGPPTAAPDQAALLKSADPKLAANKKLVFDMWRAIIQGAHTELAPKYFTKGYIQHNPNVATGRDAMVAYMKSTRPVRPIEPTITFPVIAIMAEGDLVMVATVSYSPDPQAPDQQVRRYAIRMFRIENGKIAEHGTVWRRARRRCTSIRIRRTNPDTSRG